MKYFVLYEESGTIKVTLEKYKTLNDFKEEFKHVARCMLWEFDMEYKVLYSDKSGELHLSNAMYESLEDFKEGDGETALELLTKYSKGESYYVLYLLPHVGELCVSVSKYTSMEKFEVSTGYKGLMLCKN